MHWKRSAIGLLVSGVLAGCSSTSSPPPPSSTLAPTPDIEATVTTRVLATIQAAVPPTPTTSPTRAPTPARELAQSRAGRPLSIWSTPDDAWFSTEPILLPSLVPVCTIAPYTDVQILAHAVQLQNPGPGVPRIAHVESLDGRCTGYVVDGQLT